MLLKILFGVSLQLKKAAFAASVFFVIYLVLLMLSLLGFIGAEYDILVRWVSVISLVLMGVFVGMLISEKKIPVKTALVNLLVVLVGLALVPIVLGVSATLLNATNLATETKVLVAFLLSTGSGMAYFLVFIFYSKRRLHDSF
jgi:hypothetical protein